MQKNLITQGTIITARHKNSEFSLWDIQPLLEKKGTAIKMHTIDTMGKNKSKKCYLDFKSNTLFMLLKNKSLILSMVTFGFSKAIGLSKEEPKNSIRFKKVYIDLISKKKDNNSLQHLVAVVNTKNPQSVYAQAFVKQGKNLWNFCLEIEDDFDQVRENLKDFKKYISTLKKVQPVIEEQTLEINPNYLNSLPSHNVNDEQSQSNNGEEAEDIRNQLRMTSGKDFHLQV